MRAISFLCMYIMGWMELTRMNPKAKKISRNGIFLKLVLS